MKLLFDANISWRIISLIQGEFPESIHVRDSGIPEPAKDIEIWNFALEENFIIVTI